MLKLILEKYETDLLKEYEEIGHGEEEQLQCVVDNTPDARIYITNTNFTVCQNQKISRHKINEVKKIQVQKSFRKIVVGSAIAALVILNSIFSIYNNQLKTEVSNERDAYYSAESDYNSIKSEADIRHGSHSEIMDAIKFAEENADAIEEYENNYYWAGNNLESAEQRYSSFQTTKIVYNAILLTVSLVFIFSIKKRNLVISYADGKDVLTLKRNDLQVAEQLVVYVNRLSLCN